MDQALDFYEARKTLESAAQTQGKKTTLSGSVYHPLPPEKLYISESEWCAFIKGGELFNPFGAPENTNLADRDARKGRDFADIRFRIDRLCRTPRKTAASHSDSVKRQ